MAKPAPLPLEKAQARLLDLAKPLAIEHVEVEAALGRYLAEPVKALRTQPAADLSAMDGYAVRPGDLTGPWTVIGESAAGHPFTGKQGPGEAVRIATGALMPEDADCVILQEDIARDGDRIRLSGELPDPASKHVRREGLDFRNGDEVMASGTRIGPAQVALAISAGHSQIAVRRIPRVAIIDSGDELSSDPGNCGPDQIPASNGAMLLAMVRALPCQAKRLGPVADDMDAMAVVLAQAEDADVIVTSGGASVGDHDLVRPAMEAWGAKIDFWRVAIKPGKPLLVATRNGPNGTQIILGLPGNPVSSHVTAYLFLMPVLRALLGAGQPIPLRFETTLASPVRANGPRREFQRAFWDGQTIDPQVIQDSGALAALAASNALIDREPGAPKGTPGDRVFAFLLENGGIA